MFLWDLKRLDDLVGDTVRFDVALALATFLFSLDLRFELLHTRGQAGDLALEALRLGDQV